MKRLRKLTVILLLSIIVGFAAALFYISDIASEKTAFETIATSNITLFRSTVNNHFKMVITDLMILSEQHELEKIFRGDDPGTIKEIAGNFLSFVKRKKLYDQIRYIDKTGMEVARVNYNNGDPTVVPEEKLQNKAHRYYFKETLVLEREDVFVSPFDLNIEKGEIERPLKPMIRFGTPVFDRNGVKQGVLIVNYLGSRLIESLKQVTKKSNGEVSLLNSGGYWLYGPKQDDEWGFMFKDKEDRVFGALYPDEWRRISEEESGQFSTPNGLFTFATIFPLLESWKSNVGLKEAFSSSLKWLNGKAYSWKLVSIVPTGEIGSGSQKLFFRLGILYAVLVGLLAFGSWLIDSFFSRTVAVPSERLSPWTLLIVVAIVLFFAELMVMFILPFFQPLTPMQEALVDSSMLFILVMPTLYFLLFRPLILHIDERHQAEAEREKVISDLDKANVELKDFAYIVSHDLKAPLRAISSLAGWIKKDNEDKLDDESRENLDLMLQRTKRMNNLIQGILEYSRVGRLKDEPELLNCGQIVHEVADAIHPPENIRIRIDGNLPPIIYDYTRLNQIFQNLISNAINHIDKPRGEIVVSCKDKGDLYEFCVKDNGSGIEERHFKRIFKIFQSLKPRDEQESTGIGLALVKKIVESHGGSVRVESKVGEGSEFYFTIKKQAY